MDEVDATVEVVTELLNGNWNGQVVSLSDIGIVTPYRKQCDKIRYVCKTKGYDKITIGTAEVSQGQERLIMIVSTVRTNGNLSKFVVDERVKQILKHLK